MKPLPKELVSLVHHVQLNQQGWWDDAIERLILATLWESKRLLPTSDITEEIRRQHDVEVDAAEVDRLVHRLASAGAVVLRDGAVKVAEEKLRELERLREDGEHLEARVIDRF